VRNRGGGKVRYDHGSIVWARADILKIKRRVSWRQQQSSSLPVRDFMHNFKINDLELYSQDRLIEVSLEKWIKARS
jgi:hypothetical protein